MNSEEFANKIALMLLDEFLKSGEATLPQPFIIVELQLTRQNYYYHCKQAGAAFRARGILVVHDGYTNKVHLNLRRFKRFLTQKQKEYEM